jgi:hypothetical protein
MQQISELPISELLMAVLDKVVGFVLFFLCFCWLMADEHDHRSALLVGTYANSILYTLELLAVIRYYSVSKSKRDPLLLQAIVYFTFVVDTVSTIFTYICVYLVCN